MKLTKVAPAVAVLALVVVPVADAKAFKPGDLRVCAATRCVPITNQRVLNAMGAFYYGSTKPVRASAPKPRAPYIELRFRNGYVTGIAGDARFDRFLSFGVNLDQFAARTWYAIPPRAAADIKRLATSLRPQLLANSVLNRSH